MKLKNYFRKENGFTLVELILASSISLSTIMLGYFVLRNIIEGNKIDEIQFGLNSQVNDALDFIIDEVESGERIIDNESDIRSLNNNCSFPSDSKFIFGIKLPNQALAKSDYITGGDQFNLSQIDCPIVYSLKQSTNEENGPYELIRYGPQFNEKGFYLSPSFNDFQNSTILENISSKDNYKKIECNNSWKSLKTMRGLSYCIDNFNKAIEIQIKVEDNKNKIANNPNTSLLSSGGFSRVQDSSQISLIPPPSLSEGNAPNCIGGECCWLGVCLKSRKITFMLDISENMDDGEDFLFVHDATLGMHYLYTFHTEIEDVQIREITGHWRDPNSEWEIELLSEEQWSNRGNLSGINWIVLSPGIEWENPPEEWGYITGQADFMNGGGEWKIYSNQVIIQS